MDTSDLFASMGKMALYGLGIFALIHIYLAICLTALAKKTNTKSSGLAWVPLVQPFYMLTIGRRSGAVGLLYFVPVLNVAAFGVAWMSIAEARGKSPWLGILALFPVIGLLFVPWILASGPATNPDAMWGQAKPQRCPKCNAIIDQNDDFCGECGTPVALGSSKPRMSGFAMGMAALPLAAGFMAIGYFGGNKLADRAFVYTSPQRKAPELSSSMGGTLSYFPIDPRPGSPSKPQSVSVASLTGEASKSSKMALPRGIDRTKMKEVASAVSTTVYKGGKAPVTVNVATARTSGSEAGPIIAERVASSTGGQRQGVNLQTATGEALTGQRVDGSAETTFILWKDGTANVIMIHTPSAGVGDAEALVKGIGGKPSTPDATVPVLEADNPLVCVFQLPAKTPEGFELIDFETQTLDGFLAGPPESPNTEANIAIIRQSFGWALPQRTLNSVYQDHSEKRWEVSILDYGRIDRAWMMERFFGAFGGKDQKPVTAPGYSGFFAKTDDHWVSVARKGPYLVLCEAPKNTDPAPLEQLMAGLQL